MRRASYVVSVGIVSLGFAVLASATANASSDEDAKIKATLEKLPAADRAPAGEQKFCAVQTGKRLGSMGVPVKLTIEGQSVFLCCGGCKQKALANPKTTLATVAQLKAENAPKPKS